MGVNPLIIAAGGGVLILALFFVLSRGLVGSNGVEARVEQLAGRKPEPETGKRAATEREKLTARTDKALKDRRFAQATMRRLAQANLKLTLTEYMLIKVFSVAGFWLIGMFLGRGSGVLVYLFALIAGVVGWFVPDWYVGFRIRQRLTAFNTQLADTIVLLANSLRSGYSFLQSIELVGKESTPPMSEEFRRAVREVGLGVGLQEALQNLLRRMPSEDLDLMITAVNIQFEVGGNLAVILDTIGHTIRERIRIKGEIKTLTAMGRISGYIISGLLLFLGIVITLINPKYMASMFNLPWLCMPICGGIMVVIGFLVIQKIVTIDV